MKAAVNIKLIAFAVMLGSAAGALAEDFGRAGGTVGTNRVVTIGQTPVTTGNPDFSKWYGNAGGPVGAEAIAQVVQAPVTQGYNVDYSQWYGRAGGPVGMAAVTSPAAKVARAK